MSTFNRNTLALALAAALLPASAFAYTVTTAGDLVPETIATQAGSTITTTQPIAITIAGSDSVFSRLQAFNIRITLIGGAKFNTAAPFATGGGVGPSIATWTQDPLGFDTTPNAQIMVIPVKPGTAGVTTGDLLVPFTLNLTNVPTAGLTQALVQLTDPVTGNVIAQIPTGTLSFTSDLITRANGVVLACNTLLGDLNKKIDVASDQNTDSKTLFTPGPFPILTNDAFGAIGSALIGGQTFFNAGQINVTPAPLVTFAFVAGDKVDVKLTGTFGTAVTSVFLSKNNDCSVAPGNIPGTLNLARTEASFFPPSIDPTAAAPANFPQFVCVGVDGTTPIDQSTLAVSATFTRGTDASVLAGCDALPMEFNGSVVKVFNFNPGGNTNNKSFLRVSNWGNTPGKVTIEGWDDSGSAAPLGDVTFNIASGQSVQINSDVLEAGGVSNGTPLTGALGDGTGKWRLIVTGEFDGMTVQSLLRNVATEIVTNLTDADNRGEQVNDGK